MKSKTVGIIEKTTAMSLQALEQLAAESDCILQLTVTAVLEAESAHFEGGDTWVFDRYRVNVDRCIFPVQPDSYWMNNTLIMPGVKKGCPEVNTLQIGSCYIAFYNYSAMARGYSLEGLLPVTEEVALQIAHATQNAGAC